MELLLIYQRKKGFEYCKTYSGNNFFCNSCNKNKYSTKKTTLEVLIKSVFIEKVYAENEATGGQTSPSKTTSSPFQYVLLFVAFSTLRFFQKQPRLRTLK